MRGPFHYFSRVPETHQHAAASLAALAMGRSIDVPTVLVVAHPDDEILGMGGTLRQFRRLLILQLTDGAPVDLQDATRLGFADRFSYAREREREARRALHELGLRCRRICLNAPDRDSIFWAVRLMSLVEAELRRATLVFTHPYEGGHPDHDTAALIVQRACARIASQGEPTPARLEFTSYHHHAGRMITGQFWPQPDCARTTVALRGEKGEAKKRALAQYRTQAHVIAAFCVDQEHYRAAPRYDFSRPPPPGIAQYDLFGWTMTSARWRHVAGALLPLFRGSC